MSDTPANGPHQPRGLSRRRGMVVAVSGTRCAIEFCTSRCARCPGYCATNGFGRNATKRLSVEMRDNGQMPTEGTPVWVAVPERAILRAAIAVFGLPLGGLAAAAVLGAALGLGDANGAALATIGLVIGFLASAAGLRLGARLAPDVWLDAGGPQRVGLLNQDASVRSDARSHYFETGRSRIT